MTSSQVIGTASSDEGREAVMKSGALSVYNHRTEGYDKQVGHTDPCFFLPHDSLLLILSPSSACMFVLP